MSHLFNAKCKIQSVLTPESSGTYREILYDKYIDVPCRINWSQGQEKLMFGRDNWFRDAKVYCLVLDITVKDKLIYKDQEYNIVDVANPDESNSFMVLSIKRRE